jgi:hypothetical protein
MLEKSSVWAVLLSVCAVACGGSSANTAASEPEAATPAEAAPAEQAAPAGAATPAPGAAADPATSEAVSAATAAAESWLKWVDAQQYDESWKGAASPFRRAINAEGWSQAVGGVRGSLGALGSRRLASANYTTSVPGGPDGQYVIIVYDTSFEKKAAAVETVTPMLDDDGVWRVAGYYIK